jgi:uncharacterized membrane protein (UPF0127 family)
MSRLVAFSLAVVLALSLAACGGEGDAGGPSTEQPDLALPSEDGTTADEAEPIPFRRDGTLHVLEGGTQDTLVTIAIEAAATDSARTRGLMQRAALPEQSGMLFLFDREQRRSFWMANTPLALDILFADAEGRVVRIAKYTTPFSARQIASERPAQYVLEVPAGFADTHGLTEGDRLAWTLDTA